MLKRWVDQEVSIFHCLNGPCIYEYLRCRMVVMYSKNLLPAKKKLSAVKIVYNSVSRTTEYRTKEYCVDVHTSFQPAWEM